MTRDATIMMTVVKTFLKSAVLVKLASRVYSNACSGITACQY